MAYSYAAGAGESVKGTCEPIIRLGASHADTIQKAELAEVFNNRCCDFLTLLLN